MTAPLILWLLAATGVFMGANGLLRAYATSSATGTLVVALLMFCVGNVMMVRLMRASGLGLAIAASSMAQLILITALAWVWFGERPSGPQIAGLVLALAALGCFALAPGRGA